MNGRKIASRASERRIQMMTQKKIERENSKKRTKDRQAFAEKLKKQKNFYEQVLWEKLRGCQMGVNFRYQEPLEPTKYVADFYCSLLKLDIEVDGGIHETPEKKARDQQRDARLEELGIQVFRVTTKALQAQKITKTLYRIRTVIEERTVELGGVIES